MVLLAPATVVHAFSLPLGDLASRNLFQGADVAADPRTGALSLFQAQAQATGPGDVEDLALHHYRLDAKLQPTYVDTMVATAFGHVQSLHVRISAAGNPWAWLGGERYDTKHRSAGYDLLRVRHRRGIIDRSSADVERVWTGPGSVQALPCPDWTVVLRRPGSATETYEWHSEAALVGRKETDPRPVPVDSITVPRGDTTFQSAAAAGAFDDLAGHQLARLNGATEDPSLVTLWTKGWPGVQPVVVDVTAAAPPGLTVTSEEPESALRIGGRWLVGKRFNSITHRVVAYFWVTP